jgi:hypothetical protein
MQSISGAWDEMAEENDLIAISKDDSSPKELTSNEIEDLKKSRDYWKKEVRKLKRKLKAYRRIEHALGVLKELELLEGEKK